ncbi:TonB-dependent receptor domain-containing protein [Vacuolonema iberomarrocanum]|uniref:TonB-dependent receptor domain-containing protein n=1 Tax=Vacuolonema iberomarrocanum TaxID=3454632 RepID=UPI001A018B3E|nr:TonB-dependent receptor [filamentous cyanobacterium LEGE 07170]
MDGFASADTLTQIAQTQAPIAITDIQLNPTSDGIEIVLVSDQPLATDTTTVEGNAFIINVSNATLELVDQAAAEQFSPADGIALVQATSLPGDGVQIAITGTDSPPDVQVNSVGNNLVLSVVSGTATTATDDPDGIQIVVTATRTEQDILDLPRSVTVIEREELEQQLQFTNNLPDILGALVPGLGPPNFQNSTRNLSLRGRTALVLIDGIPQNPNSGFGTELNTIDPNAIERIEVLRGPSANYGDGATGGVINIITRAATDEPVVYDLGIGADTSLTSIEEDSFGYTLRAGIAVSDESADARISASFNSQGARFDANGDRVPPETGESDTDRFGLFTQLGLDLAEEQRLELTYSFYNEALTETDIRSDPIVFAIDGLQTARAADLGDIDYEENPTLTTHVANLTYRDTDFLGSQLDAQVYYRDTDLVQIFADLRQVPGLPPFFPQLWQTALDSSEWGVRVQLDTPLGNSASLLWGVDYSQEDNERPLLISDTDTFDETGELDAADRSLVQLPRYDLNSLGLFAQAQWDITEQWQISGGVRYDDFDFSVDDYELAFGLPREREGGSGNAEDVSFNLGILYRPIPEIGIFASFAQGFSVPDLGQAFGSLQVFEEDDDISLEPQQVDNYEIGVRFEFGRVQASIAGFYNESSLGSSLQVGADGLTNLVRSPQRNYGVEATLDWQPSDIWRLGGYFSWNEGENDNDDDGNFEALSSVQVQPYKVGLYVENDTTPGWTNRLQLLAVGDRDRAFDDGVDGFEVNGYVTLDFLSSIQIGQGQLTLGIENLLNNQYLPVSSQERFGITEERRYAAPGITVSLRYSIRF